MNGFKAYPTSAGQEVIDGFAFRCIAVGISNYKWYCTAADASVGSYMFRTTYYGDALGERVGDRFRTQNAAMKAVAKALRKQGIKP